MPASSSTSVLHSFEVTLLQSCCQLTPRSFHLIFLHKKVLKSTRIIFSVVGDSPSRKKRFKRKKKKIYMAVIFILILVRWNVLPHSRGKLMFLCQHERHHWASSSEVSVLCAVDLFPGTNTVPQPQLGFALCKTSQQVTCSDWPTYRPGGGSWSEGEPDRKERQELLSSWQEAGFTVSGQLAETFHEQSDMVTVSAVEPKTITEKKTLLIVFIKQKMRNETQQYLLLEAGLSELLQSDNQRVIHPEQMFIRPRNPDRIYKDCAPL